MKGNNLIYWTVLGMLVAPEIVQAAFDCNRRPTCAEMGYTETASSCSSTVMLKCPFDQTAVFCLKREKAALGVPVVCRVGSKLYSDLKCYDTPSADLTLVGIVFDETTRLAVDLKDSEEMPDSPEADFSVLGADTSHTDGKYITKKIVKKYGERTDYAAGYCNAKTDGLPAGSWFLPSSWQLSLLQGKSSEIAIPLVEVSGDVVLNCGYGNCSYHTSIFESWETSSYKVRCITQY